MTFFFLLVKHLSPLFVFVLMLPTSAIFIIFVISYYRVIILAKASYVDSRIPCFPILVSKDGSPRACSVCRISPKPDRSHHCSACNKCILKMDHHCPWVGGCIGVSNQRFFVLFVVYGAVYCSLLFFAIAGLIPRIFSKMDGKPEDNLNVIFLLILSAVFSIWYTTSSLKKKASVYSRP